LNGFKNLVAVSCASGFEFPQAAKVLKAAAASTGSAGPAAAGGKAAAPVEEEKKEEEDVDMGGLFGDDDGY